MSRVFVAEELALGRRVVVKILERETAQGLSADRFAREARLAARLQDPRIVPVLAAGVAGDLPYYTMPFVDGESLRARLTRAAVSGQPVPLEESVSILRDIALALDCAHTHDVVHRDIKPENVLLSGRTALVADFGIARALAAADTTGGARGATLTQAGTSLGTPAYMAPEQAAGDAADHRADVYAWGVIGYELLAGHHPFGDKTSAQQLMGAHIAEQPVPLAARRRDVPAGLAAVVMQALEKDPAARPQSARQLVATLDATSARISGETLLQAKRSRRPPMWMIAGTTGIVVAVVGGMLVARRTAMRPVTDPALIAVVPFRVSSGDASLAYLREGMVDLIAAKLIRSPRTVDQRSLLVAWRRAGGGPTEDLDRKTAARVAASLGAGRLIEGDIVGNASQLTVTASIATAPDGSERGRRSARGEASQIAVLVDSVIAELLALDAGETEQRVASLASTPLAALEAYLAGQASYRAGRYPDAVDRFAEALQVDSTFALAGFGLSLAAVWTRDPRGALGRDVAVRYADKLGMRDRLYLGPTDPDSAPTEYATTFARNEAAVRAAPDSPELWYLFAENLFHNGATVFGTAEAYGRSIGALEQGLALDSSFVPMLEHLPSMYRHLGDTARERAATNRLMRDTKAYLYPANRVVYALDSASRAAAVLDLDSKPPYVSGEAVLGALLDDVDLSFAQDLLRRAAARRATAADRAVLTAQRYFVAINQGSPGAAAPLAATGPRSQFRMFVTTFADGDSTAGAEHYAVVRPLVRARPPNDLTERRAWVTAIFDLAQYELARGDMTHASSVIKRLRGLPRVPGDPVETVRPGRLAMILDAQLAKLADRADAPRRLALLDSMLALGPIGFRVGSVGNLVLSRLWERADSVRAYQAVQRWRGGDGPDHYLLFATYLREQGRLGARVGDTEGAIAAYRRYLRLRANAEPALARDIANVRSELEKLEKQSAGR